jgi:transcriptional regulator GlxA family with amidase domain
MLALTADEALTDVPHPEVIVFPGGYGTRALMTDEAMLAWVRGAHEASQWTTSVCTGALVLGAAGVLDGLEATTHWLLMDKLGELGARPVSRRVVEQGKVITAAGVSSGIDMALTLAARIAGDDMARAIQLAIEYDPEPPFDSGSTAKATSEIIELARDRS